MLDKALYHIQQGKQITIIMPCYAPQSGEMNLFPTTKLNDYIPHFE